MAVEIVPRYGVENFAADISVELFGHRYDQPVGIAPMGIPSLILPGGEKAFARTAKAHNIPLALGGVAGATVEDCAALAPDNLWFQLYRVAKDELAVNMDMAKRADAAGVRVLVLTLDVPARTKRPRELHARLMIPYKHSFRTVSEALKHPHWLAAYFRHGMHGFANYAPYAGDRPTLDDVTAFVRRESGGSFTWDEVKRFRDAWPGALVIKGLLHPGDAERAVETGADGVIVSNHGGRQLEAAPPAIDALPAVVDAVGGRTKVLFDSGGARRDRRCAGDGAGGRLRVLRPCLHVWPRRPGGGRPRLCRGILRRGNCRRHAPDRHPELGRHTRPHDPPPWAAGFLEASLHPPLVTPAKAGVH